MGKRASGSQDEISSLQEGLKRARRRKTTPDDAPAVPSTTATQQAAQIHRPSRPRKRKAAEDDVRPAPARLSSCTNAAAQIKSLPFRAATEPKITPCNNLRTCSAAAAAQVRLRPPSSAATLFWGAKRSRTARTPLGGRDWSSLDDGPAGLIAERLLADDLTDYIRFRAVCRPWRRCASDPRSHAVLEDRRFHPRSWIMLLGENEKLQAAAAAPNRCCRRHFLNVSTGQCIQVDVPELRDHGLLRSTTQGLLLLLRSAAEPVRLLNPLTRQVAELPPITTISGLNLGAGGSSPGYIGYSCSSSSAGLVDDGHTVLLYFYDDGMLAFAKPGDERWVVVRTNRRLMSTMSFAGRFYGVTSDAVMVVDTTSADLPPRLVVAAKLARRVCSMVDTLHLVDNGGELLLVHRLLRQNRSNTHKRSYKVYRVNLVAGKTTPAAARGRAIFIGHFRALSVPSRVFSSLSANTVYLGIRFDERGGDKQIGAYHVKDGSTQAFDYDSQKGLAHPWTIADCLAAYVSG